MEKTNLYTHFVVRACVCELDVPTTVALHILLVAMTIVVHHAFLVLAARMLACMQ